MVNAETILPLKGRTLLPVPSSPLSMNLKSLNLNISAGTIQFEPLAARIGQGLEEFTLNILPCFSKGGSWQFSTVRFLSHFSQTLVSIELVMDYRGEPDRFTDPSPNQLSFPRLSFLRLDSCNDTTYQFFSKIKSPSLKRLEFHPNADWAYEECGRTGEEMSSLTQVEVNCLISLLRTHSASLTDVYSVCYLENDCQMKLPQEVLCFPNLERFNIVPGGEALASAFSGFQFPNLKMPRQ